MTTADRISPRARHSLDWSWSDRIRRRSTARRPVTTEHEEPTHEEPTHEEPTHEEPTHDEAVHDKTVHGEPVERGPGSLTASVVDPFERAGRSGSRYGGSDDQRSVDRGCRPLPRRVGSDRGSATIWLLTAGLVLVVFSLGAAAIGAARVARHQARVAADLGALAGATHVLAGADRACARAAAVAAANSARVTACTLDGLDLLVTTEVTVEPLPGMTRVASATARAGPVRGEEPSPAGA